MGAGRSRKSVGFQFLAKAAVSGVVQSGAAIIHENFVNGRAAISWREGVTSNRKDVTNRTIGFTMNVP